MAHPPTDTHDAIDAAQHVARAASPSSTSSPPAPPPAADAPPIGRLAYDSLPPHSALLYEYEPDSGGVLIRAGAGDVTAPARRRARRAAAVAAADVTVVPLLLAAAMLGPMAWRHRPYLPWWTPLLAGVLCGAVYAFFWQIIATRVISAIER